MALRDWFARRAPEAVQPPQPKLEQAASVGPVIWPETDDSMGRGFPFFGSPDAGAAMGSTAVYTVVSVIAQEVSKIRALHVAKSPRLGSRPVPNSQAQETLDAPNPYQTRTDFWLGMTASMCLRGNAYAIGRFVPSEVAPIEMHWRHPDSVTPMIDEKGAVSYQVRVGRDDPVRSFLPLGLTTIPAREMLHTRMFATSNPLVGVTPLDAIRYSILHGDAIQQQSYQFFKQGARPGGLLATDQTVQPDVVQRLAEQWKKFAHDNRGGTAILDRGFKWQGLTLTAEESQLVEQYKLTLADAARIYRCPPWQVGLLEHSTFANVETMYRSFYVQTLSWWLEHFEGHLRRFLRLPRGQEAEFDIESSLMRTEFKTRMEAFGEATRSGIYTINEVREWEGLARVEGGDTPYVQAQMVALDQVRKIHETETKPPPAAPPPTDPPPAPPAAKDDREEKATAQLRAELHDMTRASAEQHAERDRLARRLEAAAVERLQLSADLGQARQQLAELRGAA